jgi:hypothetical protein
MQAGSAGAIYLNNGATATLVDSVFEGNIAEGGTAGAVRLATVGQLDMQGITMRGNEVGSAIAGLVRLQNAAGSASGLLYASTVSSSKDNLGLVATA